MESELDYTATKPAKQLTCGKCPFAKVACVLPYDGVNYMTCGLLKKEHLAFRKCFFTKQDFQDIARQTLEVLRNWQE